MSAAVLFVLTSALAGLLISQPNGSRVAFAAGAAVALLIASVRAPRATLVGLLVWLVALGLVRRLMSHGGAISGTEDPLLLVGPSTWGVLVLTALSGRALHDRTRLTSAVLLLVALLTVSVLNPLQGGLGVGLGGLLIVVVPMGAFLIGRSFVDDRLFSRLLQVAAGLGIASALYGLFQTFVRMPSWDAAWVEAKGYAALNVGGVIRSFASFSSASEYAGFLGISIVIWVAHARGLRWPLTAAILALLSAALWYQSSRGIVVITVAAVGLVLSARTGMSWARSVLVCVVVIALVPTVVGRVAPSSFSENPADRLAEHQVDGLADPFGEGSTLPFHIELVGNGLRGAIRDPLGRGVGAVSIAADKFGGAGVSTEADPGDVAVALGMPGLLTYLAILSLGLSATYRLARRRRDTLSLAALGILVATSLQWLDGGQYSVAFWPWLVLGWVDRATASTDEPKGPGFAGLPRRAKFGITHV